MLEVRLKIIGDAGQGIKTIAVMLAEILIDNGRHVALSIDYGTDVRAGAVKADIVFSETKIGNPLVDLPDLCLILSSASKKDFRCHCISYEDIDFEAMSEKAFGRRRFANMIALGKLCSELRLQIHEDKLLLPEKFRKENLEALGYGYVRDRSST